MTILEHACRSPGSGNELEDASSVRCLAGRAAQSLAGRFVEPDDAIVDRARAVEDNRCGSVGEQTELTFGFLWRNAASLQLRPIGARQRVVHAVDRRCRGRFDSQGFRVVLRSLRTREAAGPS